MDDETFPVDFRADGTVILNLDREIKLRRPKFGEFRSLRESFQEVSDRTNELALALQIEGDLITQQMEDNEDREAVGLLRKRSAELTRSFTTETEDLRLAWFIRAVATVAADEIRVTPGPAFTQEDAEPWMASPEFLARLVTHWQTVPFRRGASG